MPVLVSARVQTSPPQKRAAAAGTIIRPTAISVPSAWNEPRG